MSNIINNNAAQNHVNAQTTLRAFVNAGCRARRAFRIRRARRVYTFKTTMSHTVIGTQAAVSYTAKEQDALDAAMAPVNSWGKLHENAVASLNEAEARIAANEQRIEETEDMTVGLAAQLDIDHLKSVAASLRSVVFHTLRKYNRYMGIVEDMKADFARAHKAARPQVVKTTAFTSNGRFIFDLQRFAQIVAIRPNDVWVTKTVTGKNGEERTIPDYKAMMKAYRDMGATKEAARGMMQWRAANFFRTGKPRMFMGMADFRAAVGEILADRYIRNGQVILAGKVAVDGKTYVDLNAASPEELSTLKGIGAVKAAKVVEYREKNSFVQRTVEAQFDACCGKGAYQRAVEAVADGFPMPVANCLQAARLGNGRLGVIESVFEAGRHGMDERLRKAMNANAPEGRRQAVLQKLVPHTTTKSEVGVLISMSPVGMPRSLFLNDKYVDLTGRTWLTNVLGQEVGFGHRPVTERVVVVDGGSIMKAANGGKVFYQKKYEELNESAQQIAQLLTKDKFYVIRDEKGHQDVVVVLKDEVISLTHAEPGTDGKYHNRRYDVDYVLDPRNICMVADNSCGKIYSTSQGRQDECMYFDAQDDEACRFFLDTFDDATFGQYAVRREQAQRAGKEFRLTKTMLVDAGTRMSSHLCGMGMRHDQGVQLENILIVLRKDGNEDGNGKLRASAAGRMVQSLANAPLSRNGRDELCKGLQIQNRAFTEKATVHTWEDAAYDEIEDAYSIYRLNAGKAIADRTQEEQDAFAALEFEMTKDLGKAMKAAGKGDEADKLHSFFFDKGTDDEGRTVWTHKYDAVMLYYDEAKENDRSDMMGDLNFWKDTWEYRRRSGLNTLLSAHWDEDMNDVATSAQMLKVGARIVTELLAKDEKQGKLALADFEIAVKQVIDDYIYSLTDLGTRSRKLDAFVGFKKIDTDYVTGLLQKLNKDSLQQHPELLRVLINDLCRTLGNAITLDRYPMMGHAGMFNMDPSYALLKAWRGDLMTDNIPQDVLLRIRRNGAIEVYDPAMNKWFDEHNVPEEERYGSVMKYPAMGTMETAIVYYLSDKEMARRINALNLSSNEGVDMDRKLMIAAEFANLKYGSVHMPSDLETLGWILAGSDRDGDKGCFSIHEYGKKDYNWFLRKYGFRPLGVKIGKKGIVAQAVYTEEIGPDMYGNIQNAVTEFGNEKVGPITNVFRIVIQPLCAYWWTPVMKRAFLQAFAKAFEMKGSNTSYDSVIGWGTHDDFYTAATEGKATYEKLIDQLHKMKPFTGYADKLDEEWAVLIAICKDLDVLGRHDQELIIDAAKKFFKVDTSFTKQLRKVICITPLRFGAEFSVKWDRAASKGEEVAATAVRIKRDNLGSREMYHLSGKKFTDGDIARFRGVLQQAPFFMGRRGADVEDCVLMMPDFFAPMRAYAVTAAKDALLSLVKMYNEAVHDEKLKKARNDRNLAAKSRLNSMYIDADQRISVATALRYFAETLAKTVHTCYGDRKDALRSMYITADLDRDQITEYDEAIRRQLHKEFDELMGYVDNNIRLVVYMAERNGYHVEPDMLINYLFGADSSLGRNNANSRTGGASEGCRDTYIYAGQLLKAETAYTAILNSQYKLAREEIHTYGEQDELLDALRGVKYVQIAEGKVCRYDSASGEYVAVNSAYVSKRVEDNMYGVIFDEAEGRVYVTRSIEDFIDIPTADENTVTIPLFFGSDKANSDDDKACLNCNTIIDALKGAQTIRVTEVQNEKGYYNPTLVDENGTAITQVYAGGAMKEGSRPNFGMGVVKTIYDNIEGEVVNVLTHSHKDKKGATYYYGFVTLNVTDWSAGSAFGDEDEEETDPIFQDEGSDDSDDDAEWGDAENQEEDEEKAREGFEEFDSIDGAELVDDDEEDDDDEDDDEEAEWA